MHRNLLPPQPSNTHLGFTLHGSGPEHVLVMHDWLGDHTNYDAILPYLDSTAFTYAFVDLRGYGLSMHLAGAVTINEIATDSFAVADHLGWRQFHLVGHSMTGMATQRMAADAPERIQSAVAICPISAAGNPLPEAAAAFFASTCDNDAAFCRLIQFVTGGLSDGWAKAKLRQNRACTAPEYRPRYLHMLTTTRFVEDVQGLETPFLIIVGSNDPGLDETAMKQTFLAWHPNAELVTLSQCGHYPMQECPPHFVQVVERFLLRHTR
ncbi:alpha/beta hydrolase [Ralstonia insidiosa]|jgi:3-oxoadipate enol-lactonase|uniref:alpha/beta fold hydrolase n=2 Tax=Pseudomonadota TaxID=1224 RepID=UPI000664A8FC|nr:alpha/beta hydrolase [Ralstonia insidiosa]KMW46849.1 alpha/beta hydrolase [Ralstonia sp. MD27]MBX3771162.1 alpha/beta hydrolase [Ralstonia pickettii]NOZ18738.1 alpha/beta hydrolase [Betaproteobacteria bacterium]MBA9855592.1 alpha/beta hydrolase [Ralstonia insidiosa]MBA9869940.1 alpha/beta hydrolase [Ralstonia insidiosa]